MSILVPIVTPINNALGIAVGFEPTAIFSQAIEAGTISISSCFIVEIPTHNETDLDVFLANASFGDIVQSKVRSERINLLDEDIYSIPDYGNDIDSGEKYRTKIYIKPDNLLKPNTTYAALLSKDLSLLSVFDIDPNAGNSGTGSLSSKGLFLGLASDTYTITIASSGDKNTAKYMWSRVSDGFTSTMIEARGRLIEIDKGLQIEFEDGDYIIGDSFTVKAIVADRQVEIYSWTFATGSGDYQIPDDERSGDLLNLPVIGGSSTSGEGLFVTNISPANAESLVKIPRKANVAIQDTLFLTLLYTSLFNEYTIELLSGGIAGSETVTLTGSDIQITIEDGVSTSTQIASAFNASALVNINFEAVVLTIATQSIQAKTKFSKGIDATKITVTFNKDLNPSSITDNVKVTTRPVYPSGPEEELSFTTVVSGKQLTITLQE